MNLSEIVFYKCNPNINKECKKDACQKLCKYTTIKEYSADGKRYKLNADNYEFEEMDARQ